MGVRVSVGNQTPYTWYFATQNKEYTRVNPGCTKSYKEKRKIHRYIYIRYENHTSDSFKYEFNTYKCNPSFILKEIFGGERSEIELHCTSEGGRRYCQNYGKM